MARANNTTGNVIPAKRSAAARWAAGIGTGGAVAVLAAMTWILGMPGKSFSGPLPPLTAEEAALAGALSRHVHVLGREIGERRTPDFHAALDRAKDYIAGEFRAIGYEVEFQEFPAAGKPVANVGVGVPGTAAEGGTIVFGAHYDSAIGASGANDNASGVAGLIELARWFKGRKAAKTVRFVAYANEEMPFFGTDEMGALRDARLRQGVTAMLSLESLGYYDDAPGSQKYPAPLGLFYPSAGDFIGFVGNLPSGPLVRRAIGTFRKNATVPSQGVSAPGSIAGIGWSDHWAYWNAGYPAIMVTDTAIMRDPYYHTPDDRPERLDYGRMARVVAGLQAVLADLAGIALG
jgi:Zn-dependent M28 family amino/carboxypeptidase